jgi:hypothetical protein
MKEAVANLNRVFNYPPGWVSASAASNFKYRPVGVSSSSFDSTKGEISYIVRMNRISADKLLTKSNIKVPPDLTGAVIYYFDAANIVDGTC